MDLDAILAQAAQNPVDTITVGVCVDPSAARQRARLLDALEQARRDDKLQEIKDQRFGAVELESDAHELAALADLEKFDDEHPAALLTLKFARLDGREWAELRLMNPARPNVPIDLEKGYNVSAVSEAAARKNGVLVTDEGDQAVTPEQWDALYGVLSGHDAAMIEDAVWTLNEYYPAMQVEALVKDSGAA